MKVTFVVCNIDLVNHKGSLVPQWESTYREGIASIAALLRSRGIHVQLMKLSVGVSRERLGELWREHCSDSDVAAFTLNTVDFHEAARVAAIVKDQSPRVHTVCGGVHPTLCPEQCIAEPAFDTVCCGEGEHVMLDLCARLESGDRVQGIEGLWTKHAGVIERSTPRPLITDLSALPPPARDLLAVSDYDPRRVQDNTFFLATRGCPYECAYCCNHSLSEVFPNPRSYYRHKSVDAIIGELRTYVDAHPSVSWLALYDDVMMGDRTWFAAFAERYQQEIGRRTFVALRWELLDERTIPLLKKIRVIFALVGVEVGDEQIRRDVLNRRQSNELIVARAALLRKHGIRYGVYTMVGVPTETHEKALETVKLAARVGGNPLLGHHTIFFPFEGTPLHRRCEAEGLLSARTVQSYFSDTRLDMTQFTRDEIRWAHRHFQSFRLSYWLSGKLPDRLRRALDERLDRRWRLGGCRARVPRTPHSETSRRTVPSAP